MIILPEKQQCAPTCHSSLREAQEDLSVGDWLDGPWSSYAETEDGVRYVYTSYALAIVADETSANIALWAGVNETVSVLLKNAPLDLQWRDAIADPVILWRERPSISEEDGTFRIFMRLVVVPRDAVFLPAKPLTVGEQIAEAV